MRNNLFINESSNGVGPSITYGNHGVSVSNLDTDYNLLHGTPVVEGDNGDLSLTEWQDYIGGATNSLEGLPQFADTYDLHCNDPLVLGNALPLDFINLDIDGDNRDLVAPNLGADEHVGAVGCAGDVDNDGTVSTSDLLDMLSSLGPCDNCPQDMNNDGQVNVSDFLLFLITFGSSCE